MNHYVYEITNLVNGMKYIGKRTCKCNIEDDNYMSSSSLVKKAIKKYGINNFKKDIVFICNTEDEAYEKEEYYISLKNAVLDRKYYNLCGGGKGVGSGQNNHRFGKKISEKHREILAKSNKERIISEESKLKMSKYWKGKRIGEENPFYGKTHTEEARRKMSIASSNKIMSDETRLKISEALKGKKSPKYGKKLSSETKEKISSSRKGKLVGGDNPWAVKVVCINTNEIFNSISEAGKKYNIEVSNITACCKGRRKTAGKMKWEYYTKGH